MVTVNTSAERQRHSIRAAIRKLKDEISIAQYLDAHGVEVKRNRAKCIAHGGDNPQSFSIDPERQVWHCFSCGHGGDLIDLCELAERHVDTFTAIASLSTQFNVETRKSDEWHEWQGEKGRRRSILRNALAASYQRRLFRLFRDDIELIEDERERKEEARALWESIRPLAISCAQRRMQRD